MLRVFNSRELSRNPDDDQLSDPQQLQRQDLALPRVREVHLPCIQEDGLGGVALYLLLGRLLQEVSDEVPEGVTAICIA